MKQKAKLTSGINLNVGLILGLSIAVLWSFTAMAQNSEHKSHEGMKHHATKMTQIKTQAEAEALKSGDSMAMVCSMCKYVVVHPVDKNKSHVEMMTIGNTHTCAVCGGKVTVKGTGRGEGKNEEVTHVCSKCGDDAMFVVATKSSGEKHKHD